MSGDALTYVRGETNVRPMAEPLPTTKPNDRRLNLRIPDPMLRVLATKATAMGLGLSAYVRHVLTIHAIENGEAGE